LSTSASCAFEITELTLIIAVKRDTINSLSKMLFVNRCKFAEAFNMYYDVKNPLQLLVVMILEDSNSIKYFYENQSNFVKFGMHNI
jgi:hypothetical protein